MKSATAFLLAARQSEIAELERLAATSELVSALGRFTHALQRERGLSNVFLASHGQRFAAERQQQAIDCQQLESNVRDQLERLDTGADVARNGARLFSRIAMLLHAMDALPGLRLRIARQQLATREAVTEFSQLIAQGLAVVFEAVDSATDPEISRALVGMFNFMQGKELAGQERAVGAAAFAVGEVDCATQHHWRHLVESQQGCFRIFQEFAAPAVRAADEASHDARLLAEIDRLRRVAWTGSDARVPAELATAWFEACSQRLDEMKSTEALMAVHLRGLCERRIGQARAELRNQQSLLDSLAAQARSTSTEGAAPLGPQLERSVLDMVHEQARRLQAMGDELETVRASLTERKVVERAKGLLMAHRQLTEPEAYKMLRQMAMNQNRRMVDVANAVLSMAEVLPVR